MNDQKHGFGRLELPKNKEIYYVEGMQKDDDIYYGTIKMRNGN